MGFQEKLQAIRKERGLSQEGLAEGIGISRQAVAKWEAGQSYPDIENLIALSDLFKISIDKLVRTNEDECSVCQEKKKEEDIDHIIDFLCRAKKETYAGKGNKVASSRPNSYDYRYEEDQFLYYDTYLGGEKFAGEEGLWIENTPYWAMNYVGRLVDEGFSGDFLKEALLLVPKEYPYRGPMVYQNGEYIYHCTISGDFEWFNGHEEIYHNNKKVYECIFHGGFVR